MSQLNGNIEIFSSISFIFQCRKMRPEESDCQGYPAGSCRAWLVPGLLAHSPISFPAFTHPALSTVSTALFSECCKQSQAQQCWDTRCSFPSQAQ